MANDSRSQETDFSHFSFRCSLQRHLGGDRPAGFDYSAFQWYACCYSPPLDSPILTLLPSVFNGDGISTVRAHSFRCQCHKLFMPPNQHRPPNQFIAPVQEPYTYIIFRASEVKDLAVDEQLPPVQQHSVLDDPAVIGVRRSIGLLAFPSFCSLSLFHFQPFRARGRGH